MFQFSYATVTTVRNATTAVIQCDWIPRDDSLLHHSNIVIPVGHHGIGCQGLLQRHPGHSAENFPQSETGIREISSRDVPKESHEECDQRVSLVGRIVFSEGAENDVIPGDVERRLRVASEQTGWSGSDAEDGIPDVGHFSAINLSEAKCITGNIGGEAHRIDQLPGFPFQYDLEHRQGRLTTSALHLSFCTNVNILLMIGSSSG